MMNFSKRQLVNEGTCKEEVVTSTEREVSLIWLINKNLITDELFYLCNLIRCQCKWLQGFEEICFFLCQTVNAQHCFFSHVLSFLAARQGLPLLIRKHREFKKYFVLFHKCFKLALPKSLTIFIAPKFKHPKLFSTVSHIKPNLIL